MSRSHHPLSEATALLISTLAAAMLAACGGGNGGDSQSAPSSSASSAGAPAAVTSAAQLPLAQEPNAPRFTGSTEVDGFNWFNYRRQQLGLSVIARNGALDFAAQSHSNYQKLNDTITHDETAGKPGFTGATLADRLKAAGYAFNQNGYAYGEVISATGDTSGFNAADDLIAAIYHRFLIFEPTFKEAGIGAATVSGGYTYFTTDFAANGLDSGIGRGNFITYPAANQQRVPTIFYSDRETPDPVPNQNEVGYPISIHADITATVGVQSFTLKEHAGAPLPAQLLSHANNAETPASVAAIIPLNVLSAHTTYDVQFIGTVSGTAVNRSWSFTTQ
ncbi:MAG: hypothetical protein JWQ21_942 [Herminiimonas sp.]|nr:hypothetical protein [Herminiimonas sp.]